MTNIDIQMFGLLDQYLGAFFFSTMNNEVIHWTLLVLTLF